MPSLVGSTRAMLFSKSGQWLASNIQCGGKKGGGGGGVTELFPSCRLHDGSPLRLFWWIALRLNDERRRAVVEKQFDNCGDDLRVE